MHRRKMSGQTELFRGFGDNAMKLLFPADNLLPDDYGIRIFSEKKVSSIKSKGVGKKILTTFGILFILDHNEVFFANYVRRGEL